MKLIINRAFFGKSNCFKLTLNEDGECYFHFGIEENKKYLWKKVKISDVELGDILGVIEKKKVSIAFFHDYNGTKTQIWVNMKEDYFFIKVKELSKSFSNGEQNVLRILIEKTILEMNLCKL